MPPFPAAAGAVPDTAPRLLGARARAAQPRGGGRGGGRGHSAGCQPCPRGTATSPHRPPGPGGLPPPPLSGGGGGGRAPSGRREVNGKRRLLPHTAPRRARLLRQQRVTSARLCRAVPCRYKATEPHRQRQRRVSRPGSRRRAAVTLGGGGGGGGDSPGGGAAGQERRCPRRAAAATRPRCGCGCGGGGAGEPGCGCTSAQPSVSSRCRRAGGCGLPIAGCRPPHARRQRRKVPRRAAPPCRQPGNAAGGRPGRAGRGRCFLLSPPAAGVRGQLRSRAPCSPKSLPLQVSEGYSPPGARGAGGGRGVRPG